MIGVEKKRISRAPGKVELLGVPNEVTAEPREINQDATQLVFQVKTTDKSPAGRHKSVICRAVIMLNGEPITHTLGTGELRIDAPLPPAADAPAAADARGGRSRARRLKRLTRLEQLRQERQQAVATVATAAPAPAATPALRPSNEPPSASDSDDDTFTQDQRYASTARSSAGGDWPGRLAGSASAQAAASKPVGLSAGRAS